MDILFAQSNFRTAAESCFITVEVYSEVARNSVEIDIYTGFFRESNIAVAAYHIYLKVAVPTCITEIYPARNGINLYISGYALCSYIAAGCVNGDFFCHKAANGVIAGNIIEGYFFSFSVGAVYYLRRAGNSVKSYCFGINAVVCITAGKCAVKGFAYYTLNITVASVIPFLERASLRPFINSVLVL